MSTLNVSFRENYAIIELNRPRAHAINKRLVTELREELDKLEDSEHVDGAILTATGNIFCAGLDLVELYGYDEATLDDFWEDFGRLLKDMAGFSKPLVAAINGHAPAGGCVLAMCCDYRFMADGNGRIGLNEVAVGVVLPTPIVELARHVLGDARATDMMLHGALLLPQEAGAFGLVHATVPPDELVARAEEKLQSWLALPAAPWREAKKTARRPLLEAMDVEFSEGFGETIHHWWSTESRATMGKMVQKLKERSAKG